MVYTDVAKKQQANKYDPVLPNQAHGRMRVLAFDLAITAENATGSKDVILGYLPAGEGRVILESGAITGTIAGGSTTVSIGLGAYTPIKGGPRVAADKTAIAAAAAIGAVKRKTGSGTTYSAADRVPVTLTASVDLAANDKISGYLTYIID